MSGQNPEMLRILARAHRDVADRARNGLDSAGVAALLRDFIRTIGGRDEIGYDILSALQAIQKVELPPAALAALILETARAFDRAADAMEREGN